MATSPVITVLMPVYNADKFLHQAIESILNQTFHDFEFLIINDGSTDKSEEIILSYLDPRIKYEKNEKNSGIIYSLNKGIGLAKGKYIARMDADDISLSERFSEQLEFLETNTEIGICGSNFEAMDEKGNKNIVYCVPDDAHIKATMLFFCPMAHPSVMIRREVLSENNLYYKESFYSAEDYELWWRLSLKTSFANINKVLLRYRLHEEQVSNKNQTQQQYNSDEVRKLILKHYQIEYNQKEYLIHNEFGRKDFFLSISALWGTEKWLKQLLKQNSKRHFIDVNVLSKVINDKWKTNFYHSSFGIKGAIIFLFSPLTWIGNDEVFKILRTTIECLKRQK